MALLANPAAVLNRADKVLSTVDGTLERVDGTLSSVDTTLTSVDGTLSTVDIPIYAHNKGDVPPYMIADGMPAEIRGINQVGMERRGFEPEAIRSLREAYRIIYRENLNVKQALEKIRETLPANEQIQTLLAFVEATKRGIVR